MRSTERRGAFTWERMKALARQSPHPLLVVETMLSTVRAEVDLKREEAALRELQNHAEVVRDLLEPDRYRS
jgi:hypothetical protein